MTERIAEVYSLLIPLADARLLVPRACVAEVIGYQTPAPMESAPPWYLGLVNWNARSLPLVSFEGACGLMIPLTNSRSRIVVFHALAGRAESGYIAHRLAGIPAAGARQQRCRAAGQFAQLLRTHAGAVPGAHAQRDAAGARPGATRDHDRR